ncbi:MAG: hypothetical protein E7456_02570 [Ruminococcaceae bacterium]|nr:hypothetical protein [Oscillospiraceae bacterium]
MAELKKHWKFIASVVGFMICLAVVVFWLWDMDVDYYPDQPINIYLTVGAFKTTGKELAEYGFYSSTHQIVITAEKLGGFEGVITFTDGERIESVEINDSNNLCVFDNLDHNTAYTFICQGMDTCTVTVSEKILEKG